MNHLDQDLLKSLLDDSSFKNWIDKSNKNDILFWNNWITDNPTKIETIESAKAMILGITFKKTTLNDTRVNEALDKVLESINDSKSIQNRVRPKKHNPLIYSFAALALIFFGLFMYTNQNSEVIHITGYGEIIDLKLLDGTMVTLNGNSEIRYDKNNSRNITLKGEAYFKVKPIPATNAKFWVNTEDLRVEVFGTQFHVNSREEKTDVLLDEGSINLLLKNGESKKMVPGELVSFSKSKKNTIHQKVSKNLKYSLWREGTYIFNNMSLLEVMEHIKHTYGLSSEFVDKELEQKTITGGIPNHDLKICLSAIEKSTGTRIVLKDEKLFIINNKN